MNAIQAENANAGTSAWKLTNAATNREIEGYCNASSVPLGGSIQFKVSSNAAYTLDIYRMGYYGGLGGRFITGGIPGTALVQPMPAATGTTDPTVPLICAWSTTYTLAIPTSWTSGIYVVKMTRTTDGKQAYLIFCVRDDARAAKVVYVQPTNTYQAYNAWGGKSLYTDPNLSVPTAGTSNPRYGIIWSYADKAQAVSSNRPHDHWIADAQAVGLGAGHFFCHNITDPHIAGHTRAAWEHDLVMWLESKGYDVSYVADEDLDTGAPQLATASLIMSAGHDEYWTEAMRDRMDTLRNGGTHLMFMGANHAYWRIRYDPASSQRTIICYKDETDPATQKTDLFRIAGTPEEELCGVEYVKSPAMAPYTVVNPGHWAYAGTGVTTGQAFAGLGGYEVDSQIAANGLSGPYYDNPYYGAAPPGAVTRLAHYWDGSDLYWDTVIYQHPTSLAWVFSAGSLSFSWALNSTPATVPGIRSSFVQPALQTMVSNIMTKMGVAPSTLVYDVEYRLGTSGPWLMLASGVSTLTQSASSFLALAAGTYQWQVVARDPVTGYVSPPSTARTIVIATVGGGGGGGGSGGGGGGSMGTSGPTVYDIQVQNAALNPASDPWTTAFSGDTELSFSGTDLVLLGLPLGNYRWRVVARDSGTGATNTSASQTFTLVSLAAGTDPIVTQGDASAALAAFYSAVDQLQGTFNAMMDITFPADGYTDATTRITPMKSAARQRDNINTTLGSMKARASGIIAAASAILPP